MKAFRRILFTRRAFLLAITALVSVSLTNCEMLDQVVTPMFMMSPEDEVTFGKECAKQIEKDLVFVNDPAIVAYVRKVGEIVKANAPKKAVVPTQFFVVKNPEINAFAIPGGNMYVHTGLINAAEDEAEMASVMAHEYGHVVYRHGAKHVSRATGASALQQILVGGNQAGELVTSIIAQGALSNYGRSDELEADSIAVPTLIKGGYDPRGMVTFFETMKKKYGDSGGGLAKYFGSHPPTGDRIARVNAQIAQSPNAKGLRPINDLRAAQARLQDLGMGPGTK